MRYPVWLFSFAIFFFLSSVLSMPRSSGAISSREPLKSGAEIICQMSAFFSLDPENGLQKIQEIEGRGLISCKNNRGFTSDFPIALVLKAEIPLRFFASGEFALSANSPPFVVQREISQIDDEYVVRSLRVVSSKAAKGQVTSLFRGIKHDLAIEMKINSMTEDISGITPESLRLEFDHSAPDWGWGEN